MNFNYVPAYAFGKTKKCELEKTEFLYSPGPGAYCSIELDKGPSWKIGTQSRKGINKNNYPGPGQYNIRSKVFEGPKYTMSIKSKSQRDSNSPGPGEYNLSMNDKESSSKYTMGIKLRNIKKFITPGPGNYNIRSLNKSSAPSYSFGKEKKRGPENLNSIYVPGPGNYDNSAEKVLESNPKFSFGKNKRGYLEKYDTPGPGDYELKKFFGNDGPKLSISSKLKYNIYEKAKKEVPGPGQYKDTCINNYKIKMPSYKIGISKREFIKNSDIPGPANYLLDNSLNMVRHKDPAWKIGMEKRHENIRDTTLPGVGDYNVSKGLGEGPKYSIKGRNIYFGRKNKNPGPGEYNTNASCVKANNPSWSMGKSERDAELKRIKREGFPGPGNYDCYYQSKMTAPRYKFGNEKREYLKKNSNPGPGQYHIPCCFDFINNYTREQGSFDPNFQFI